jgi:hypothetical protein
LSIIHDLASTYFWWTLHASEHRASEGAWKVALTEHRVVYELAIFGNRYAELDHPLLSERSIDAVDHSSYVCRRVRAVIESPLEDLRNRDDE